MNTNEKYVTEIDTHPIKNLEFDWAERSNPVLWRGHKDQVPFLFGKILNDMIAHLPA